MYHAFFHFREAPFSITPDPAFLYLSPHHHEALAHLLYGTGEHGGFVLLTGEVGTGKTTVVRTLLEQRFDDVDIALILNPRQSVSEFLHSVCDELGAELPAGASGKQLVDALNRHLLATHAQGRRTVLIIDEAQNLPEDLLEQVRLLTNLETHKQKLLRIMLIGQPELGELLARPSLRQLAQRITARYHLPALQREETAEYIAHRLRVVGGDGELFDRAARNAVHRATGGIPRLINVLCDRVLLAAYSAGTRHITAAMVREAARELAPQGVPSWWQRLRPPRLGWMPGVALAGMLLAAFAWTQLRDGGTASATDAAPAVVVAEAGAPPTARQAAPDTAPAFSASEAPQGTAALSSPAIAGEAGSEELAAATLAAPQLTSTRDLLLGLQPLADQLAVLLGLWDASVHLEAGRNLCDQLGEMDLRCLRDRGDWPQLAKVDRPAILTLVAGGGDRRHLLLRALDDDVAVVLWRDDWREVSRATVDLLWNGEYFLVWRNSGPTEVLREGSRGEDVVWLREALAAAAGEPLLGAPRAVFDSDLRQQVEGFQRAHGLDADGQVGERTLLQLMRAVAPGDPSLRPPQGDGAAAGA